MNKAKENRGLLKVFLGMLAVFLVFVFGILLKGNLKETENTQEEVTVEEVIDGDTIRVKDLKSGEVFRVRYLGIDAPELEGLGFETCFAENAKERNEELVLDKNLILEFDTDRYDQYGRTLAYVYTEDNIFVNLELLQEGLSRFYFDEQNILYQDEFIDAVLKAQEDFFGLWGSCGEEQFNNECVIKGNIDASGKKFYHLPEDKYYDETIVNLDKGDQWLCTIEEAKAKNFDHALE